MCRSLLLALPLLLVCACVVKVDDPPSGAQYTCADAPDSCPGGTTCDSATGVCREVAAPTCADAPDSCPAGTACDSATGVCREAAAPTCADAPDSCPAGTACDSVTGVCREVVEGTGALGEACARPEDCDSGQCADGVCCASACAGLCQRCDLEPNRGTCTPVAAGADPDGECTGDHPVCGSVCDGAGACSALPVGDTCGSCGSCDASGRCEEGSCPAPTLEPTYLGNPAPGGFQLTGAKSYARNVWDMIEVGGKLIFSFGNAANIGPAGALNSASWAGPAPIMSYDPATNLFKSDYLTREEQISYFRWGDDGRLYTAGIDGAGSDPSGYIYYLDPSNSQWTVLDLKTPVHAYDATAFGGRLFANKFFTSDPANWPVPWSNDNSGQYLQYPDALYLVSYYGATAYSITPTGTGWVNTGMSHNDSPADLNMLPGIPLEPDLTGNPYGGYHFGVFRPVKYGSANLYLAAHRINDHQYLPAGASVFMATSDITRSPPLQISRIGIPAGPDHGMAYVIPPGSTAPRTHDILVKEKNGRRVVCILVEEQTAKEDTSPAKMRVYRSESDLSSWTELFNFTVPTFARSFEYINGVFYFGLGSEISHVTYSTTTTIGVNEKGVSDHTGKIYSIAYDLFASR